MTRELKEILGRPVDIVTDKSLLPAMRPSVERDLKIILAA
jgi:predicted nucleotidyltransferase